MTPHKKEVSKRGSARSSANWAQSHTRPSPNRATESQMLTEWHDTPTIDGKPKKSPRLRGGSNRDAAQCFKSSKPRLIGWRTRRNGITSRLPDLAGSKLSNPSPTFQLRLAEGSVLGVGGEVEGLSGFV